MGVGIGFGSEAKGPVADADLVDSKANGPVADLGGLVGPLMAFGSGQSMSL